MPVLKYAAFVAASVILGCAAARAWSQAYPAKPVRVINAFAPGGPNDLIARPILEGLSKSMGQQFVLENKPGANGNIGTLEVVRAAYEAPSLYDEALRLLARRGFAIPASHLERDWTQPYQASREVEQAWLSVYREPQKHWDLYQLGEELTDLEDAFRLWRFRHVTTVERIIGFKRGTGGTGGVPYLRKMLDVVLFPEIWQLRTDL